jgi:hypothetical protein
MRWNEMCMCKYIYIYTHVHTYIYNTHFVPPREKHNSSCGICGSYSGGCDVTSGIRHREVWYCEGICCLHRQGWVADVKRLSHLAAYCDTRLNRSAVMGCGL